MSTTLFGMRYHPKVPIWVVTCRGLGLKLLGLLCSSLMASGTEGLPAALCPTPGGTAGWAQWRVGEDSSSLWCCCCAQGPEKDWITFNFLTLYLSNAIGDCILYDLYSKYSMFYFTALLIPLKPGARCMHCDLSFCVRFCCRIYCDLLWHFFHFMSNYRLFLFWRIICFFSLLKDQTRYIIIYGHVTF